MPQLLDPPTATNTKPEHSYFKIYKNDPSPWYIDNDTWSKLLYKIAIDEGFRSFFNMQALGTLHTARRFGTMIKWDMHRGHILIPDLECGVWDTQEYWDYCKKTYFMQYAALWKRWFYLIDHD